MSSSARAVALELVRRVTDERAYSNLLLPVLLDRAGLSDRDRALATELAYGTVRRLIPIDHALGSLVDRPLAKAPGVARAALRMGAYQLLYMRVPAHAAVDQAVDLTPPREKGFVNAVLRKLSSSGARPHAGDEDEEVSLRTGLTSWAVTELRRLLGPEAEAAAEALATHGPLTIRSNPCAAPRKDLEEALGRAGHTAEPGHLHPGSLRVPGASPRELPGFEDGWFAVQDEASSFVVDVLDPQPGELILDACAGPGGKASDIACRSGSVIAADLTEQRIGLVRGSARRLKVDVRLLAQDASRPALRQGFDRVLVDAPCSGMGAARRRPELLWRPNKHELSRLARLQVRLAAGAASLLKPGGVLTYSVCTFPRAETDAACDALLGKVPYLRPDPIEGPDGKATERVRLWPHIHGTDAMFVARFRRDED